MNFSHSDTNQSKLTIEQRELLYCLFEEAAEVTQIVAKILRFGYTTCVSSGSASNAELLHGEVADFLGIVDRLTELNLFSAVKLDEGAQAKLCKLENYLLYKGDTDIVNY
jgi:hypothetical protein